MSKRNVSDNNKFRIQVVFGIMMVLLVLLAFRLAWIMIVKADDYKEKATNQQMSDIPVEAKRGSIYDTNGKELATSVKCYSVYARPQQIVQNYTGEKLDEVSKKLAVVLDQNAEKLKKEISSDKTLVRLGRYLDKDQTKKIREMEISGVEVAESTKRYYPMGTAGAQLLGSVTDENVGRTGLEAQFDTYLSGVAGRWIEETDLNGDTLSYGSSKYYAAQDGSSIKLTINEVLQHYAEDAVAAGMKRTKCKKMMCLVMNPKTGDILAMVTSPSFDPNDASEPVSTADKAEFDKLNTEEQGQYLSKMWTNPIISSLYEPGSTFKLITTSAALEEGVTTPDAHYYDSGAIDVDGVKLHCWQRSGHGNQTLTEAVGNSCNTVQVRLAQKLGANRFYNYLEMFGITDTTHVSLPAETSAIIKDKDELTNVDFATMSYGQGIAVTPLQLLTAVCAIGNDGVLMQPRIVKEVIGSDGKTKKKYGTHVVRKVISSKTADEMKDIMEFVVDEGGGHNAAVAGYRIGGKTGTANKAVNGKYSDDTYSSFVGMAPMEDPQLAIIVIGDSPKGAQYGSVVGAPVAHDFLKKALTYMEISPKYTKKETKTQKVGRTYVPEVKGMNSVAASASIQKAGLKVKISPAGDGKSFKVKDQYPKGGTKVNKGDTVYIYRE